MAKLIITEEYEVPKGFKSIGKDSYVSSGGHKVVFSGKNNWKFYSKDGKLIHSSDKHSFGHYWASNHG